MGNKLTPADRVRYVRSILGIRPYDELKSLDGSLSREHAEVFLIDLLADLRHFADAEELDFARYDKHSEQHYLKERETL